ncbi:hypothetical protein C8Q80DRAFT_1276155 [Daedaleopsis nitida]|nr:hypothetical protein C8Q80DRAFT_1276155 [Daedaleopsis nitida]
MSATENLAKLAGPLLLGQLINWGLTGALSVQVYLYHLLFPHDPIQLRLFVYTLLAFEWVQTGLITANSFDVFGAHYGDVENLLKFHNSWFSVPIMCGVVSVAVQFFYARRIWALSKSMILVIVICTLSLAQGCGAIASGVLLKNIHSAEDQAKTTPAISVWLGGSAIVDIVIAVAMTILLLRSKTGLRHSDSMVNKLVRLVIESGMITASVAIVDVVMFAALPDTLYHECPALALAKLYANMMVTSLNNRAFLQRSRPNIATVSMTGSGGGSGTMAATETTVRVNVLTETDIKEDSDYPLKNFSVRRDDLALRVLLCVLADQAAQKRTEYEV